VRQFGARVGAGAGVAPRRDTGRIVERQIQPAKVDQQAEVLDVERHRFLRLPGAEQFGVVVVGAQQPGAPAGVSHFPPLSHELPGVPVDPLAGLLVEVQPDAVDVRGDFLIGVALRPAHDGGKGVPERLAPDVARTGSK